MAGEFSMPFGFFEFSSRFHRWIWGSLSSYLFPVKSEVFHWGQGGRVEPPRPQWVGRNRQIVTMTLPFPEFFSPVASDWNPSFRITSF